jgi:hypothetical protein
MSHRLVLAPMTPPAFGHLPALRAGRMKEAQTHIPFWRLSC